MPVHLVISELDTDFELAVISIAVEECDMSGASRLLRPIIQTLHEASRSVPQKFQEIFL